MDRELVSELRRYGAESAQRLREIADDPETPLKLRAEIERFFFDAVYGRKAPEGEATQSAVIKFEGELEKWSE